MTFKADLHIHSYFSDGVLTPEEIVDMAVENGLSALSITDHDTIDAYPEIFALADEKKIKIIPGAEFSASMSEESVHILAYSFDTNSAALKEFCSAHHRRRRERCRAIIAKCKELGMSIDEEDFFSSCSHNTAPGRPLLARMLIKRGYATTIKDAFKKYLAKGSPCFVPGKAHSVKETIEVIREARGLAFLAHPHLIRKESLLRSILELKPDGLECYYARFDKERNAHFLNVAEERGLLISGGSDFHGGDNQNRMGSSWTGQKEFAILYEHFRQI